MLILDLKVFLQALVMDACWILVGGSMSPCFGFGVHWLYKDSRLDWGSILGGLRLIWIADILGLTGCLCMAWVSHHCTRLTASRTK